MHGSLLEGSHCCAARAKPTLWSPSPPRPVPLPSQRGSVGRCHGLDFGFDGDLRSPAVGTRLFKDLRVSGMGGQSLGYSTLSAASRIAEEGSPTLRCMRLLLIPPLRHYGENDPVLCIGSTESLHGSSFHSKSAPLGSLTRLARGTSRGGTATLTQGARLPHAGAPAPSAAWKHAWKLHRTTFDSPTLHWTFYT